MTKKCENRTMFLNTPSRTRRKIARRALALSAGALILMGCESKNIRDARPDDYRLRHPITLEQSAATIDIPVGVHSEQLTPSSRSAIRSYARDFHLDRAAVIQVMVPSGSGNESSAGYMAKQVRTELMRSGVKSSQIDMITYPATGGKDAPIRLAYPKMEAKVPECGTWPDDFGQISSNRSYFNFGCATQKNLAASVANPQDLIQPRGWDPRDSGRRSQQMEDYRKGSPTWSEDLGNNIGSSSEVSK
ncbi:MAG: CpaD family pilus assembly protein [Cohaesibacter sp.]|jgi:pilus assembly protein CpaD|nr:CpaD family pilus assembly protein [Cohaesibacter sp.]